MSKEVFQLLELSFSKMFREQCRYHSITAVLAPHHSCHALLYIDCWEADSTRMNRGGYGEGTEEDRGENTGGMSWRLYMTREDFSFRLR